MRPTFDDKDADILKRRIGERDTIDGPRVGDFVRFANGTLRRISYIWRSWDDADPLAEGVPISIQTSDGGSYHLGWGGYVSMSGSLYCGVKPETLSPTDEVRMGSAWFFHHNHAKGENGVYFEIPCRVFECSLIANGDHYREAAA